MFCFGFLYKFGVYMIGKKKYSSIYVYAQTSQIDRFVVSIKFCDESGLEILKSIRIVLIT